MYYTNIILENKYLFPGEFVLTKPKITMKAAKRQYSVNESYSPSWDKRILAFVNKKKQGSSIMFCFALTFIFISKYDLPTYFQAINLYHKGILVPS